MMRMDNVEFDREPPANLTTMVMAFGGWIDAGRAATGALRHLARELRAERLAQEAGDEVGLAEVGRLGALRALRLSDYARAVDLALAARDVAQRFGILQLQAECAGVASVALRRLGRTAEAEASRTEALRLFERLGAEKLKEDLDRLIG